MPGHVGVEVLEQAYAALAAGVTAPVAGELDEVEPMNDRSRPREVGQEDEAGLQQPDENRLATGVVLGDLPAELGYPGSDLLCREVDRADAVAVDAQEARSR